MTLPLMCPACQHPATPHPDDGREGFTCARYRGEPPTCRDCAAIIGAMQEQCNAVLRSMLDELGAPVPLLPEPFQMPPSAREFEMFDSPGPPALSPVWAEQLWAAAEQRPARVAEPPTVEPAARIRGITLDSTLYIYDELYVPNPWTADRLAQYIAACGALSSMAEVTGSGPRGDWRKA